MKESVVKREEALNKKLDKLRERQDENALTFEQLGVDYLVVDEAHHFKNLAIRVIDGRRSNLAGFRTGHRSGYED